MTRASSSGRVGGMDGELQQRLNRRGLFGAAEPAARAAIEHALAQRSARRTRFGRLPARGARGDLARPRPRLDGRSAGWSARSASPPPTTTARPALEAARADAEALNIGKSRFLANMSHELRTPLNAIMGFADMMRQRIFGPLPGKYVEYADLIHDAGAHLLDLINDVLDMSKIEASKYELALEEFDAREPVAAALRLLRVQADESGVQLRGLLPAEALEVNADRRALKQIVINLVSNALKFTPRGGLVTVSLAAVGRRWSCRSPTPESASPRTTLRGLAALTNRRAMRATRRRAPGLASRWCAPSPSCTAARWRSRAAWAKARPSRCGCRCWSCRRTRATRCAARPARRRSDRLSSTLIGGEEGPAGGEVADLDVGRSHLVRPVARGEQEVDSDRLARIQAAQCVHRRFRKAERDPAAAPFGKQRRVGCARAPRPSPSRVALLRRHARRRAACGRSSTAGR